VNRVILLDSGPLGMVSHPKANPAVIDWFTRLLRANADVRIPEISDYEVRRELLRAGLSKSIRRLDQLREAIGYVPINTPAMLMAATLWATMRSQGTPTADDKALDGDVILAAQALQLAQVGNEVIIATDNVAHLSLMTAARTWESISF
jgi:predicted nucleic acid-binding protein